MINRYRRRETLFNVTIEVRSQLCVVAVTVVRISVGNKGGLSILREWSAMPIALSTPFEVGYEHGDKGNDKERKVDVQIYPQLIGK